MLFKFKASWIKRISFIFFSFISEILCRNDSKYMFYSTRIWLLLWIFLRCSNLKFSLVPSDLMFSEVYQLWVPCEIVNTRDSQYWKWNIDWVSKTLQIKIWHLFNHILSQYYWRHCFITTEIIVCTDCLQKTLYDVRIIKPKDWIILMMRSSKELNFCC